MDERWLSSEFQIVGATDENDLEVAMEVCVKEHILTRMKKIGLIAQMHSMEWVQRGRRAVETVAPCSYLEVYSVTNGKPVQLRQNRRDMIEARLLIGPTQRVQGYS